VTPGYRFFGIFQKKPAEDLNTALALANVSDQQATVSITFHVTPYKKYKAQTVLAPGARKAFLVDEIAPQLAGKESEGTVEIVSGQRLAATVVRTLRGVLSVGLPLGRSPTPEVACGRLAGRPRRPRWRDAADPGPRGPLSSLLTAEREAGGRAGSKAAGPLESSGSSLRRR
jgi:hypothetical protein